MPYLSRLFLGLLLFGSFTVSSAQDGRDILWQQSIPGLRTFTPAPDGAQLLVVAGDYYNARDIQLHDAATGAFIRTVATPAVGTFDNYGRIVAIEYAPDGQTFYTVHSESVCSPMGGCGSVLTDVIHWDLDGNQLQRVDTGYYTNDVAVRPDGQRVAVGRETGGSGYPGLFVFEPDLDLVLSTSAFGSVDVTEYGNTGGLLGLGSNDAVHLVDAETNTLVRTLPFEFPASDLGDPTSIDFSSDDGFVVASVGRFAKAVNAFDTANGDLRWSRSVDFPNASGLSGTTRAVLTPDDAFVAVRLTGRTGSSGDDTAHRMKFLRAADGVETGEYDLGTTEYNTFTGPSTLAFVPGTDALLHAAGDTLFAATFDPVVEQSVALDASMDISNDFALRHEVVRFTTRITNSGTAAAEGVTYETPFWDDIHVYEGNLTATSGTAQGDALAVTWTGDIPAGGAAEIAFDVRVTTFIAGNGYGDNYADLFGSVDHASLLQPIGLRRPYSVFDAERIYTAQEVEPIPDAACPSGAESSIEITDSFDIERLRVGVTAEHPTRGDVRIDLVPPTGDAFPLIGAYSTSRDNVDVLFEDEGGGAWWAWVNGDHDLGGASYLTGVLPNGAHYPETPLADRFNGTDPRGTWTLRICDGAAGDTGTLLSWSLLFNSAPAEPPAEPPAEMEMVAMPLSRTTVGVKGGEIMFRLALSNPDDESHTTEVWTAATLPNGNTYGPLLGPVTVTVAAGSTLERTVRQTVPASAPAGAYRYSVYVGAYEQNASPADGFDVTKTQGTFGLPRDSGESPWTVRDAVSGEAVQRGAVWTSETVAGAAQAATTTTLQESIAPNPVRDRATLRLVFEQDTEAAVAVFDVLGRRVATLHEGPVAAGPHAFSVDARALATGTYFVRVATEATVRTHRLTVMR